MNICHNLKTQDVLDYGCGKGVLGKNLPFEIQEYDPCIEKFADRPRPADIVVCTDVLEHIEPDCIDDVVADLISLTKKCMFLSIANGDAVKKLSDGRNAHLIQENEVWWLNKFGKEMQLVSFDMQEKERSNSSKNYFDYIMFLSKRNKTELQNVE